MSTLGLYFSVFPLSLDFWVLRILNFLGEPINALKMFSVFHPEFLIAVGKPLLAEVGWAASPYFGRS